MRAALDQLWEDDETQLFVVFVSTFDGLDGQIWADQSAQQSQLGTRTCSSPLPLTTARTESRSIRTTRSPTRSSMTSPPTTSNPCSQIKTGLGLPSRWPMVYGLRHRATASCVGGLGQPRRK